MSVAEVLTSHALEPIEYAHALGRAAREASRALAMVSTADKDRWLLRTAELIADQQARLLEANDRDVAAAAGFGLTAAATERLKLTPERLRSIIKSLHEVAALRDPVGEVIEGYVRPNGLQIARVRLPLGVVFFIYESRPNVTVDAAALCVKSGNAVILRGGKEAMHSNQALAKVINTALTETGLPAAAVQLVQTTDRSVVGELLQRPQFVDVTIPRGGKSLIERVMSEARMPVIKHYDGICHVYVDLTADFDMAAAIVLDGKCRRPAVCNATECLLVHQGIADEFLPRMAAQLIDAGVELRGCSRSRQLVPKMVSVTEQDYRTEYGTLILSVKIVDSLAAAVEHIREYGSGHTDCIVTNNLAASRAFVAQVDSAAVMVNASTRFNDGGELGLGAEIGISTDRFHARGPCGLRELTTYKYVVQGAGQIRG